MRFKLKLWPWSLCCHPVDHSCDKPKRSDMLRPNGGEQYSDMSLPIPPNSEFRPVSAAIPQPASKDDISRLKDYIVALGLYNKKEPCIEYRNPNNDEDIVVAVYRWSDRSHPDIFQTGFRPQDKGSTSNEDYYNFERHVRSGVVPSDTSPSIVSAFVTTTRSTSWRPIVTKSIILYQYEIFAPGGIDVMRTLKENNQQEISFVGGISPQYIRTARPYLVEASGSGSGSASGSGSNRIYHNGGFNPNPTSNGETTQEFLNQLRNMVSPMKGELMSNIVLIGKNIKQEPYVEPFVGHYIECAFNFNDRDEAYLFFANQCVLINYAPGSNKDSIIHGPMTIVNGFPYLKDTIFATGIDAAFPSSRKNEAYIFKSDLYAVINFVENGGRIKTYTKKIRDYFPSLRNTFFEKDIDAAFASSRIDEAYLFKGDQCVGINFAPGTNDDFIFWGPHRISDGFPSLKGTVFQDGLDAAFSSSIKNEAYIFKGNTFARINYAPETNDDYIISGPSSPISDGFHSLKGIIPMYSRGG